MFLEVFINGNRVGKAGGPDMTTLQLRVLHDTRGDSALVYVTGERRGKAGEREQLEWVNQFVDPGDDMAVRLVASGPADPPKKAIPLVGPQGPAVGGAGSGSIYCSFCGRSKDDVPRIIAGPGVFICSECVAVCEQTFRTQP